MSDAFWGAAIPGSVAILLALIGLARQYLTDKKLHEVAKGVGAVETIVNGQRTAMQAEIDGLKRIIMSSMEDSKPVPVSAMVIVAQDKAASVKAAVDEAKNDAAPQKFPPVNP